MERTKKRNKRLTMLIAGVVAFLFAFLMTLKSAPEPEDFASQMRAPAQVSADAGHQAGQ